MFRIKTKKQPFKISDKITEKSSLIPINQLELRLDDFISRANNCLFAQIEKPDDELMFAILLKNFSDRQISVEKKSTLFPDKKHLHMLLYKILLKKNNSKLKSNYHVSIIIKSIYLILEIGQTSFVLHSKLSQFTQKQLHFMI